MLPFSTNRSSLRLQDFRFDQEENKINMENHDVAQLGQSFSDLDLRSPFRFMHLPPELRIAIYELLLLSCSMIQPPGLREGFRATPIPYIEFKLLPWPSLSITVLLLNRTIYAEAIPVLYSGNKFQLEFPTNSESSHCTNRFLKIIGVSNCRLIRTAPSVEVTSASPTSCTYAMPVPPPLW